MGRNKMQMWCRIGLGVVLLAGCQISSEPVNEDAGPLPTSLRYRLGTDPVTGAPLFGGAHEFVQPSPGKAEGIDFQNQASFLHPQLNGEYLRYAPQHTSGSTTWDVFPSNWWPMSKNGTAWRWQPGANQNLNDISDRKTLSPIEKYDLLANPNAPQFVAAVSHCEYSDYVKNGAACTYIERPALVVAGPATKWELENQGTYQAFDPEYWWGHCNGWASYATAEPLGFPHRDVRVRFDGTSVTECFDLAEDCILFKMADIEALMTELYFSDRATFSGRRCDTRPEDLAFDQYGRPLDATCRDLNPGTLHIAMVGLLAQGAGHLVTGEASARPAFVIDHHYDFEVWNFPVVGFDILSQQEVTPASAAMAVGAQGFYPFNSLATRFVQVQAQYEIVSDSVPEYEMLLRADLRNVPAQVVELNYILELDDSNQILGGEWIQSPSFFGPDNRVLHPDFAWIPVSHRGLGEAPDDTGGDDDNPFVSYDVVRQILLCANDPTSCDPTYAPASLCAGNCGLGPFESAAGQCFCDSTCQAAGDCCPGYQDACSI